MKKLIAAVSTVFIAVALSVVALAAPASAHTATLDGSSACNNGAAVVTWTIDNEYQQALTVTASSNQSVIPTPTTVAAATSRHDTTATFTQNIPAPAAGVSVSITLSFKWTDGTEQNDTSASVHVDSGCVAPPTKDASAAIVDTPAGCAAAETITEGAIANATWGTLDLTGGSWSAVATATNGHVFASGNGGHLSNNNKVDTFSGDLPLDHALSPSRCKLATAAVVTAAATCQGPETITEGAIAFATWAPTIQYHTSGGVTTYSAVATATSGYEFSDGSTKLTLSGPVAGELTGHPCEDYIIVAWTMPHWVDSTTSTWSQTYFASHEESTPDLNALDSQLAEQCGVQYQVDIYYNSTTTASLIAGNHLDGPNNPTEDLIPGDWGTAYKLVQGPACATVATPGESDVCTDGGTITINAATGVVYYLNNVQVDTSKGDVVVTGLHGVNTVTATAASGYLLAGYPSGGWSYNINSDCTATYAASGDCTASGTNSQEDVSLNLVNTSSTGATFVVTSTDSTVSGSGSYNVPANSTSTVVVGSTSDSGGTFSVSINGGSEIDVVVAAFDGCVVTDIPADPSHTDISCTGNTTVLGSITVDGNPELTYTLHLPDGSTEVFPAGVPSTISGLAAGDYSVSVLANTGFVLGGAGSFPATVTIADAVDCIGTTLTPAVSSVAPTCEPNPPVFTSGKFNAALTEVQGKITIPSDPNMTFTINDGTTTSPISSGVTIEPDGTYTVVATLTSTAIANGFTFAPDSHYTLSAGDTVATFAPISFTSTCGLPTLASWHSGAVATPATCTLTGSSAGTITVVHGSDLTHTTDEDGKVTYTLVNNGNGHTTNLGSSALTVSVAPGSYTVEAVPTDPADGLVGNPNVANEIDYPLTVAAPTSSCDGTLAFTGGTIGWLGFMLAGGMLFLGIAFLYMKRRGNRTAE